ncbi:hypothetical protein ETB97_004568 [Aspergillus alliaceus]|uniref:Uncharacterized protein n=1 Tax=Petromyces alliaceus TaxID=209559 RepID=A0A8H6E3R6_PETAA|nr:hypothetical protein ETB97_004568 [Aspergillus burnettii]
MNILTHVVSHIALLCLLAPHASSYRIIEYQDKECDSTPLATHHTNHPNSCEKFQTGITQSTRMEKENPHDDRYEIALYSSDSCDGEVIRVIHRSEGCLPAHMLGFTEAKSFRLVPATLKVSKRSGVVADADVKDHGEHEYIKPLIPRAYYISAKVGDKDENGLLRNGWSAEYSMSACQQTGGESNHLSKTFRTGVDDFARALRSGFSAARDYVALLFLRAQQREGHARQESSAVVVDRLEEQLHVGKEYADSVMEFCARNQECFSFAAQLYAKENAGMEGSSVP